MSRCRYRTRKGRRCVLPEKAHMHLKTTIIYKGWKVTTIRHRVRTRGILHDSFEEIREKVERWTGGEDGQGKVQ